MRTERLYDEDAYMMSFDAQVCSVTEKKEEEASLFEIVLDRTCFFPEGGGQGSDKGVLRLKDGDTETLLQVVDVRLREGVVVHLCRAEETTAKLLRTVREGTAAEGEIDRERRFDRMQQHTGEHMVSGIVHKTFGYENVGFRLSDDHVTMDYNGRLTADDLPGIEKSVNQAIWMNLPVKAFFPDSSEQETLPYRSKKEITDEPLRLVEIPGIDLCACCAPHVRSTGEVGLLKITRLQNWKDGVRLSIVCGNRALALFQTEHEMVTSVARRLSTSPENIPDRFERLREENVQLKKELSALRKTYRLTDPLQEKPSKA